MIISDNKKFIMFCPPKVGSSTLTGRLEEYDSRNNFFYKPRWNEEKYKIEELKHITYLEFLDYEDSKYLEHYLKFCFVRNPYDRIYSGFLMRCHHIKNVKHPKLIENKEYLSKLELYLEKNNYSFNTTLPMLIDLDDIGFVPLNRFTHHNEKPVLDFIGFNERFENDFQIICKKLKVESTSKVNRIVRTDPKAPSDPYNMKLSDYKYLGYYEQRTIELVNNVYDKDFQYFGYQKLKPKDFPEKVDKDISFDLLPEKI